MRFDIILAGVGGQGILSIAYVLDSAAVGQGFRFKQAEVHGMSQRGGAVESHLRISDAEIWSDLIPVGQADLVLSVEPLESLRYRHFLKPDGFIVTSGTPFVNIPDYPDLDGLLDRVASMEHHVLVNAESLARQAGSPRAENMVMLGAASWLVPIAPESLSAEVGRAFEAKGEKLVRINQDAFAFGRAIAALYREGLALGMDRRHLRVLCEAADPRRADPKALPRWKAALEGNPGLLEGRAAGSVAVD